MGSLEVQSLLLGTRKPPFRPSARPANPRTPFLLVLPTLCNFLPKSPVLAGSFLPISFPQNQPSPVPRTWHGSCYTSLRHREYRIGTTDRCLRKKGFRRLTRAFKGDTAQAGQPSNGLVKAQGSTGLVFLETEGRRNGPASWSKTLRFNLGGNTKVKNGRGREDGEGARKERPDIHPTVLHGNAQARRYERRESFEG